MQKPTVLAQAGKDLFLSGFVQDATFPMHLEPRHPAVAPNLAIIPEEQPVEPRVIRPESQIILVLGAPVCADWSPGVWLHHRITACIQLYKQITDTIQREQTNARCFVVPTGGDSSNVGVLESEIIRNRIIAAGISPHQIIMGCVQANPIDNALQLLPILRRLQIQRVHIITSEFHIPRIKMVFDGILGAVSGMNFSILYHPTHDAMTAAERVEQDAIEQSYLLRCRPHLNEAMRKAASSFTFKLSHLSTK